MNILIAINDGYFKPARVMLTSLCENNSFEKHQIYLLYSELSEKNIRLLRECLAQYGSELIDIYVDKEKFEGLPTSHHFTIETYYRFLMQSMVPESLDRILWLDADMIVKGNIKEFYYQDFAGNNVVVCQSINSNTAPLLKKLCLKEETVYFNAGIILFNLNQIRKCITPNVYFEYARDNADKITWLDQDVLNVIFADTKKVADYKIYNLQHFSDTKFDKEALKSMENENCVLHYIGHIKPWHYKFTNKTLKYYRRYAKRYEGIIERWKFTCLHMLYVMKRKLSEVKQ